MLPIKIIVHPTDFSENARSGFELACALARDYRARLHVVHVEPRMAAFTDLGAVPPTPIDRRALERQLAQTHLPPVGIEITRNLLEGNEVGEINAFAQKVHADLIVMGTHGRTGLGRLLMGSVAEEVLRSAPCPVLTIKNPSTIRVGEPAKCAAAPPA